MMAICFLSSGLRTQPKARPVWIRFWSL